MNYLPWIGVFTLSILTIGSTIHLLNVSAEIDRINARLKELEKEDDHTPTHSDPDPH